MAPEQSTVRNSIDGIAVCRESHEYGYLLLDKMIQQTLGRLSDVPEAQRMLALGHSIMLPGPDGDAARSSVGAQWLYHECRAKPVALRVRLGDWCFLYGLTSAGKTAGQSDEVAWVSVLGAELRSLRPARIVCGPFSRLLRNADVAGTLAVPVREQAISVEPFEAPGGFRLTDPLGSQMWTMLVNAAHNEWQSTVTRLLTGVLFDLMNNRLPRSADYLPLGYRRKAVTPGERGNQVEPDPAARELVSDLIAWAASDMSLADMAHALARHEVRARGPMPKGAFRPLIDAVDYPESAVRRVLQYLPVYLLGQYLFTHANPLAGIDELHGQKVHRDPGSGRHGEFRFTIEFGLPDGGWADESLIRTAIERRLSPHATRIPSPHDDDRKALAGLGLWTTGDFQYHLGSKDHTYTLRRRPASRGSREDGRPKGWGPYEGELTGRFRAKDLHFAVATILRQLAEEAPTDIPCTPEADAVDVAHAESEAAELDRVCQNARGLAVRATDPDEQDAYAEEAARAAASAMSLRATAAAAERREVLSSASSIASDVQRLVAVAELLERHDERAPARLNLAMRQVLSHFVIEATAGSPTAVVTLTAVVNTSLGPINLGPASASVRNTSMRERPGGCGPATARNRSIAADLLAGLATPAVIAEDMNERSARRRLLDVVQGLLPTAEAASALVDCPIPAVRLAVLGRELGVATSSGLDPQLAAEVRAVYHDADFVWRHLSWASGDLTETRTAVSWLARYHPGEEGCRTDELRSATGLAEVRMYAALSEDPEKYRRERVGDWAPLETTVLWVPRRAMPPELRRVRVRQCPHCSARPAWTLLRVPELPDGAICPECLRAPSTNFCYPIEYLQPWVGPLQGNRKMRTTGKAPVGTHLKEPRIAPRRRAR